jgi:type IV secretory pathway TrbD component
MIDAADAGRIAVCVVLLVVALWLLIRSTRGFLALWRAAEARREMRAEADELLAQVSIEEELRNDILRFKERNNL